MVQYLGIIWLGVLFLTALAVLSLLETRLGWKNKLTWGLAILALPIFGPLAWMFIGRLRAG